MSAKVSCTVLKTSRGGDPPAEFGVPGPAVAPMQTASIGAARHRGPPLPNRDFSARVHLTFPLVALRAPTAHRKQKSSL
jgi:hypothetical protein